MVSHETCNFNCKKQVATSSLQPTNRTVSNGFQHNSSFPLKSYKNRPFARRKTRYTFNGFPPKVHLPLKDSKKQAKTLLQEAKPYCKNLKPCCRKLKTYCKNLKPCYRKLKTYCREQKNLIAKSSFQSFCGGFRLFRVYHRNSYLILSSRKHLFLYFCGGK